MTVNSVLPGPTRSEGIIDFLKSLASDPQASASEVEVEFFAKHRSSSLLQRMIEPEEIANLVAYVASPLSSATNGAALRAEGANEILVVVGGVIPASDYEFLYDAGVAAVFGPGSNIPHAASEILALVRRNIPAA